MNPKPVSIVLARKVLDVVDQGLVAGLGRPIPGQMCVEAAVCYAQGLPHSDKPSCVGNAVRSFKITLNDQNWSSTKARAKGMRRVAVAQLGSAKIDQRAFVTELAIQTVRQIVPIGLRAAASMIPAHKDALKTAAAACEVVADLAAAQAVAQQARAAAYAAAYAADAADAVRDKVLAQAAEVGVQALLKCGSIGALWVDKLCGPYEE